MTHSSSFVLPTGMRFGLGADLSESSSTLKNESMSEQTGSLRANFLYNKRIKSVRTSFTLSDRTGAQKLKYHEKYHLSNILNGSGRLRYQLNKKMEVRVEESLTHSLNYTSGSTLRNTIHLGLQNNLSSNLFVDLSMIEGHSRNSMSNLGIINSRTIKGRSDVKIGRSTVSSFESSMSWADRAKPLDKAWSSRITLRNSGLFRGVSAQLSGLYNMQTFTIGSDPLHPDELSQFESLTLNANLSARVYAYRISLRYDYKQSKFNTENRYFATISRPINFIL